jgi:dTDP-4-amino-4,6-dideoxygalactose transaminase
MGVPFIDLAAELGPIRADLDRAIARVLDSGVFIGGAEVTGFERALATAIGARHAIGTSSGTDALLAILMALGVGPGAEVVTTPFTFFATAGAIARLGARVVFADIGDDLMLDPGAAERACTYRTRAVIPVHLYGATAALPDVPFPIVEDAAQALGALWRPGAARGVAAAISFFPTKNLGALGDAGAVVTEDDALADRLALLRNHGARPKYHHVAVGGNFRLDALQAAVLAAKLPHFAAAVAGRRARADRYAQLFAAARVPAEVRLPAPRADHTWHQYVIRAPRRDGLRAHLAAAGIATEIYYPEPLHLQPCFADLGYRAGSMPNAERAAAEVLALPIQPALSIDQQAAVVDAIAGFYQVSQ